MQRVRKKKNYHFSRRSLHSSRRTPLRLRQKEHNNVVQESDFKVKVFKNVRKNICDVSAKIYLPRMFFWLADFFSSFFPKTYSTSILSFSFDYIIHSFLPHTSSCVYLCELTLLHHHAVDFVTLEQDVDGWHEIVFLSITLLNVLNQFAYIHKRTKKNCFLSIHPDTR